MKRYLLVFLLGAGAGAGGYWYYDAGRYREDVRAAQQEWLDEASRLKERITTQIREITVEAVREEMAETKVVIRDKAAQASAAVMDAAGSARITASIKTRLLREPSLPGTHVNVDTTGGVVTLSGSLATHEQVARALRIAYDTDGVQKVVSTIQVSDPPAE